MKYTHYLFDFDGTLMDSMDTVVSSVLRVLDDNGITYGKDLVKVLIPLGLGGVADYYIENFGLKMEKEQIISLMREYMLYGYFNTIQPKSNVVSVLKELKAGGASLNILTASPHVTVDACLARLEMTDLFDNVWSCEDFATTKANPKLYGMAAEKMGAATQSILFLDDNPDAVIVAKSSGMPVCGVYDSYSQDYKEQIQSTADYYIHDFKELLAL